jgi:hypothetical protein
MNDFCCHRYIDPRTFPETTARLLDIEHEGVLQMSATSVRRAAYGLFASSIHGFTISVRLSAKCVPNRQCIKVHDCIFYYR